ncbi:MAG: hypothetical protein ACL7AX_12815 [Candidatus Arsenophonus phytopathogenicus]
MKTAKSTIIIKKKRRRKIGYHRTDSWKIAYADFIDLYDGFLFSHVDFIHI